MHGVYILMVNWYGSMLGPIWNDRCLFRARREFDPSVHPQQFVPPEVNLSSETYSNLVEWETAAKTEPPVTRDLPEEEILSALARPLILPPYPNHTQAMVRVVMESCKKQTSYHGRHRLILKLLESREMVKKINTKKQDAVFE